jgi:N6-adenosine-specific RNA methylase IME4
LHYAIATIDKWGLFYRGVAFVWIKTKKNDPTMPIGAQGVRPSIVKPTCELVLAASRQSKGRPYPLSDEGIRQVVLSPKQEHSRKPDEVQERIEAMYPYASKLEMFARRKRAGWDSWGDEI